MAWYHSATNEEMKFSCIQIPGRVSFLFHIYRPKHLILLVGQKTKPVCLNMSHEEVWDIKSETLFLQSDGTYHLTICLIPLAVWGNSAKINIALKLAFTDPQKTILEAYRALISRNQICFSSQFNKYLSHIWRVQKHFNNPGVPSRNMKFLSPEPLMEF